jgi:hypothetical protein
VKIYRKLFNSKTADLREVGIVFTLSTDTTAITKIINNKGKKYEHRN